MRYKVTNFDGSFVFFTGDDLEVVESAISKMDFAGRVEPAIPPQWYILWDNGEPIDKWFYGDIEPEEDVLDDIARKIYKYRDENEIYYGD
jgi:hypothetical protein